ncbi:MAG: HD domain-containing protein [Planctomycetota bacterium]|jgi:putative nucleotidyltransferase with HDIG domain|nr:HD domain-containing protein [Planctomycetota bacterium]
MAVTQTTLPAPALAVPAGLATDIERETGVSVAFFGPAGRAVREAGAEGAPADVPVSSDTAARLAREAIARAADQFEINHTCLRGAWRIGPRTKASLIVVCELALSCPEGLDMGRRLMWAAAEIARARVHEAAVRAENEAASESLLQSFEEVSLLHHLGEVLRIDRPEEELLGRICSELCETIKAEATVAFLPNPDGAPPRVILSGRLPFAVDDLAPIVEHLLEGPGPEASLFINNHCQDDATLASLARTLKQVVVVPLPLGDGLRGALLAINRAGEEFGSPDAKLVRSTSSASAIFIENRRLFRELQELMLDLVKALVSSVDAKDPYTCGHSERVALLAKRLASEMHLGADEIERVYLGGLLHDIGKIGTPERILRKAGRLEPDEFRIIKQHPEVGYNILSGVHKLGLIREVVLSHHERIDGKGYPWGLKGDQIPLLARIAGMADAFDAMTSDRPYRARMPLEQVQSEIQRGIGAQFDERAAKALLGLDLDSLLLELSANVSRRTESEAQKCQPLQTPTGA